MRWGIALFFMILIVAVVGTALVSITPMGFFALHFSGPTTYYVATTGSDLNPGTIESPFRTIQHAAGIVNPGDTIIVTDGTYYEAVVLQRSGTAGSPIIVKSQNQYGAILDGNTTGFAAFDVKADYITIDGFEMQNWKNRGIQVEEYNYNNNTSKGNNLVISNNRIHDIGYTYNHDLEDSSIGKGIQLRYVANVLIKNNDIYRTNYDSVTLHQADSNITISGNHFHDGAVDGIKGGIDSGYFIVENNIINDFSNVTTHGDGFQALGWPVDGNMTIRGNILYGSTQQLFLECYANPQGSGQCGDAFVYNNVIYNSTDQDCGLTGAGTAGIGFDLYTVVRSINIYNNTIAHMNWGNGGLGIGARSPDFNGIRPVHTLIVQNNILYNSLSGFQAGIADTNTITNNIYYNPCRPDTSFFKPLPNSTNSNPQFLNIPQHDFHISQSSPAIDAGIDLTGIVNDDISSVARPQGSGWDLGAYEYQSGAPTCTTFTYSSWSTCTNSSQSRTVLTSSPQGCTGGSPTLTQSCTPTCTDFTYSAWSACINSSQTRTITTSSPSGCTGGAAITTQSCSTTSTQSSTGGGSSGGGSSSGGGAPLTTPTTTTPTTNLCTQDSDCGISQPTGNTYCIKNLVTKNYTTPTCIDSGTPTAHCTTTIKPQTITTCDTNSGCANGTCLTTLATTLNQATQQNTDANTEELDAIIANPVAIGGTIVALIILAAGMIWVFRKLR